MPPTQALTRSRRRAELCSPEHAQRVANRLFEHAREDISVLRTGEPLQPFKVVRTADVTDPSAEIIVVTA